MKKTKIYTVKTRSHQILPDGQYHTIEENGVAVAGFAFRSDADRFAKLLNQEPCCCHQGGE